MAEQMKRRQDIILVIFCKGMNKTVALTVARTNAAWRHGGMLRTFLEHMGTSSD